VLASTERRGLTERRNLRSFRLRCYRQQPDNGKIDTCVAGKHIADLLMTSSSDGNSGAARDDMLVRNQITVFRYYKPGARHGGSVDGGGGQPKEAEDDGQAKYANFPQKTLHNLVIPELRICFGTFLAAPPVEGRPPIRQLYTLAQYSVHRSSVTVGMPHSLSRDGSESAATRRSPQDIDSDAVFAGDSGALPDTGNLDSEVRFSTPAEVHFPTLALCFFSAVLLKTFPNRGGALRAAAPIASASSKVSILLQSLVEALPSSVSR
jgi:hypothetical protein